MRQNVRLAGRLGTTHFLVNIRFIRYLLRSRVLRYFYTVCHRSIAFVLEGFPYIIIIFPFGLFRFSLLQKPGRFGDRLAASFLPSCIFSSIHIIVFWFYSFQCIQSNSVIKNIMNYFGFPSVERNWKSYQSILFDLTTMSYSADSDGSIQLFDKMHYPRTGKRGVPQQFPRRLYEMLEAESASGSTLPSSTSMSSNDDTKSDLVVHWSPSGLAFRIVDVTLFSDIILPKYFKTSKFSSFQRNLNLVSNQWWFHLNVLGLRWKQLH